MIQSDRSYQLGANQLRGAKVSQALQKINLKVRGSIKLNVFSTVFNTTRTNF
jgi:hypothetical protein